MTRKSFRKSFVTLESLVCKQVSFLQQHCRNIIVNSPPNDFHSNPLKSDKINEIQCNPLNSFRILLCIKTFDTAFLLCSFCLKRVMILIQHIEGITAKKGHFCASVSIFVDNEVIWEYVRKCRYKKSHVIIDYSLFRIKDF